MVVMSFGSAIVGPAQELVSGPGVGKMVGPVVLQLIRSVEAPETKKVLRFPVPGMIVLVPSVLPMILVMPLGFRLRPPPLNMKVRMEGWIKIVPKPARRTVLPFP